MLIVHFTYNNSAYCKFEKRPKVISVIFTIKNLFLIFLISNIRLQSIYSPAESERFSDYFFLFLL